MEAVAAFGLAVNVLQVVEYGAKLLRSIHKIYQEGASIENEELEKVTVDLQRLNDKLRLSQATRVTRDSLPKDEQVCTPRRIPSSISVGRKLTRNVGSG